MLLQWPWGRYENPEEEEEEEFTVTSQALAGEDGGTDPTAPQARPQARQTLPPGPQKYVHQGE